jgi:hypothetical protein
MNLNSKTLDKTMQLKYLINLISINSIDFFNFKNQLCKIMVKIFNNKYFFTLKFM